MDQIIAELKKIPPVTRFICGSSLVVTLSSIIGLIDARTCLFSARLVFKKLEASDILHFNSLLMHLSRYGGCTPRSSWEVSYSKSIRGQSRDLTPGILGGGLTYIFELLML